MNFTSEQHAIIHSSGNIKINAVAGSGKTSTLLGYAKERRNAGPILYIAFNKSVKLEAERKFALLELSNVKVETAHSLAYSFIVKGSPYKVKRNGGYKTHEIVEVLGLKKYKQPHTEFVIANHINRYVVLFCNSDKPKVQDLNYEEILTDERALNFVRKFREVILQQTRLFLDKMNKGEIEIIHDFYLKKFQQSLPQLPYEFILFDEAQDASDAMLDVVIRQQATKVIVGDTHQQIYGWRFAVNSLEKVDYPVYNLTRSFRFDHEIAALACRILQWKSHLGLYAGSQIYGLGTTTSVRQRAILARTNVGLLSKAVELLIDKKVVKKIYFEGRIESYTYADEGASVYDILNLYLGRRHLIKDKLIASMKYFSELEEYIDKTEDAALGLIVEIVKKYQRNLPDYIKQIKDAHVENHEKDKAGMIFSTVHRCKGLEYDEVTLVNDFITEDKIIKLGKEIGFNKLSKDKLAEEINLLYVAVTRTRNVLNIPEELLPKSKINVIRKPETINPDEKFVEQYRLKPLSKSPENQRNKGLPWKPREDDELTVMFCEGKTVSAMARKFGRSPGAIRARINRLELPELYGIPF
ncbi:MAG: UvrD-helicase domain-containing protein [Bacteroidales bacterium]|jgi:superfamily I DNA/RNA helicase|nr:UvrD-helicase domain-containing protein [Bacteroidales bacterium]